MVGQGLGACIGRQQDRDAVKVADAGSRLWSRISLPTRDVRVQDKACADEFRPLLRVPLAHPCVILRDNPSSGVLRCQLQKVDTSERHDDGDDEQQPA